MSRSQIQSQALDHFDVMFLSLELDRKMVELVDDRIVEIVTELGEEVKYADIVELMDWDFGWVHVAFAGKQHAGRVETRIKPALRRSYVLQALNRVVTEGRLKRRRVNAGLSFYSA